MNLTPQPFRSGALFSELLRNVFLGGSVRFFCGHAHWIKLNNLSPKFKWCGEIKQFKNISSDNCINSSESRATGSDTVLCDSCTLLFGTK